jgi:pimeloyl-ACP methyl ester carboxylesterase/DNA-binding SARP family transcriptional activator
MAEVYSPQAMPDPAPLTIRVLGSLRVCREGNDVRLPQSKKTRALLGYLVASGRPQSRARLCSLFWDVADDPKAALRWCLSKLRPVIDDENHRRLVSEDGCVEFVPNDAHVDLYAMRAAVDNGLEQVPTEQLLETADEIDGDLLDETALPDFHDFHAWLVAEREEARRLQYAVLDALLDRLTGDPERSLPYARRQVRLRPSDADARARLVRILVDTDRRQEAEQQYRAGMNTIAAAGKDDGALRRAWAEHGGGADPARHAEELRQEVRFCTSKDGAQIAYATSGSGPPLVKAANWLSHVDYDWKSPVWRAFNRELSARNTYIRYDVRGCGLSDRDPPEVSCPRFVEDLEAVVDAAGVDRFVLMGLSQGAAISIEYAVRHPERVKALVLLGGFAIGWEDLTGEDGRERREALATLIRTGWGQDNPAFRQIFTSMFYPNGTLEQIQSFNEMQRLSASPESALRIINAVIRADVTDMLHQVRAPTLIFHVKGDALVPHASGRRIATGIPLARFVTLPGDNHIPLEDDPGWPRFLEELRRFLDQVEADPET